VKKLLAVAVMAVLLCLVVSGNAFAGSWELPGRDRCVDNGDGTVTDNGIGLMWQQATTGRMYWDVAMSYVSKLSLD